MLTQGPMSGNQPSSMGYGQANGITPQATGYQGF